VFNDIASMLAGGLDKVRSASYEISQAHAQIQEISDNHAIEKATLQETIDDVENADPNEVAVMLNSLQVQLEASYRVTASLSQLSLAYLL
jgi:flagellar hook-associated protein 3 FlgL